MGLRSRISITRRRFIHSLALYIALVRLLCLRAIIWRFALLRPMFFICYVSIYLMCVAGPLPSFLFYEQYSTTSTSFSSFNLRFSILFTHRILHRSDALPITRPPTYLMILRTYAQIHTPDMFPHTPSHMKTFQISLPPITTSNFVYNASSRTRLTPSGGVFCMVGLVFLHLQHRCYECPVCIPSPFRPYLLGEAMPSHPDLLQNYTAGPFNLSLHAPADP